MRFNVECQLKITVRGLAGKCQQHGTCVWNVVVKQNAGDVAVRNSDNIAEALLAYSYTTTA